MPYSAPLDGIRAIAILAVLVFHVLPGALRGGFTGVDVFFVLSGFLITSIILHDLRDGAFSLREFYLRRIQRLLPNIVVTVMAVLAFWILLLPPSMAPPAGRHGLWTVLNLSNLYIWKYLGGYWGDTAEWAPLTHTWSLGVEEQFYLVFPGSLLLLARFQRRRIGTWLLGAALLSFALCAYGTRTHAVATFYLLPTRVWELLIGAFLAAHRTRLEPDLPLRPPRLGPGGLEAVGLAGLTLILLGFLLIQDGHGFPGWVSLAPTLGTALLILSIADGRTRLSRLLSTPFPVGVGKLSYSLYLWHWPLIILGKNLAELNGRPPLQGAVGGGVVGVLLAWGAYLGVEQPLRKRGPGRGWRFAVIAAGFSIVVLGAVAVAAGRVGATAGRPFDPSSFHIDRYNAGRLPDPGQAPAVRYADLVFPAFPPRPDNAWRTGGVLLPYGGGQPDVVVLGSSHALMYGRLIDDLCREQALSVAFLCADGKPAFFAEGSAADPEVREFDEARRKWLRTWRPGLILVVDRWDERIASPPGFDRDLRSFLREVGPSAGRVLLVAQPPVIPVSDRFNLREYVGWRLAREHRLPRFLPDRNEPLRKQAVAIAEAVAAEIPNFQVLRADLPFYNPDGSIRYESGRAFLYADDDHLTDPGAEMARSLFRREIAEVRARAAASRKPAQAVP